MFSISSPWWWRWWWSQKNAFDYVVLIVVIIHMQLIIRMIGRWSRFFFFFNSEVNCHLQGGELLLRHAPDGVQCVHPWLHPEDPGQTSTSIWFPWSQVVVPSEARFVSESPTDKLFLLNCMTSIKRVVLVCFSLAQWLKICSLNIVQFEITFQDIVCYG